MLDYGQLTQLCDADIRAGRPQDVARRLAKLKAARVPRQWRLPLANICRRSGLYSLGMALLGRLVRGGKYRTKANPTSAELSEYAVLLMRSGSVNEAIAKLEQVNPEEVPESLMYGAFGHFLRWEFHAAIPLLERYLQYPISSYAALVGRTNLAYSYVECGKHEKAAALLRELIEAMARDGHSQLQSSCHTFLAQIHIREKRFQDARAELEKARGLSAQGKSNDQFLVTKWSLILDGLETRDPKPFQELRALAQAKNDWESQREADLYSLQLNFEPERFLHLFFGTPFPAFRDRLRAEFGYPPREVFVLGPKKSPRLDLRTGLLDGSEFVNPGHKCHRLIDVLLRDFYQAPTVVGLFSELFPGEQFDFQSSPDRVHQLIRRTRRWLEGVGAPIRIHESGGFYSLRTDAPFSFRVPLERHLIECHRLHFDKLCSQFVSKREFSAKQAREKLALSKATFHRLMHWGLETGNIERLGESNRSAKYRIVHSNAKAA